MCVPDYAGVVRYTETYVVSNLVWVKNTTGAGRTGQACSLINGCRLHVLVARSGVRPPLVSR